MRALPIIAACIALPLLAPVAHAQSALCDGPAHDAMVMVHRRNMGLGPDPQELAAMKMLTNNPHMHWLYGTYVKLRSYIYSHPTVQRADAAMIGYKTCIHDELRSLGTPGYQEPYIPGMDN